MGQPSHYAGAAGRQYHEVKRALPEAAYPWVASLRAAKFAHAVEPEHTVVEIGVGAGWNLAALSAARKIGVDVAEFLGENLRARSIEFYESTQVLSDGLADVVICHHMLEHALNPPEVLAEAHRLLKPNGRLLLNVPSESGRRTRQYRPDEPNHHLYAWTVQTLGNLLGECRFRVEAIGRERFAYDRVAAVFALRLHFGEFGYHVLRRAGLLLRPEYELIAVGIPVSE